jgi:probable rRNA maturation factor
MTSKNFSLINKTKGKLPRLPFVRIKEEALGEEYDLSVVFVGDAESRKLNIKHRGKDYIPNVLSFELDPGAGEIFINPVEAARQAPEFGRTPGNMIGFLYVHGLAHLKGLEHGATMDRTEAKLRKTFRI